MPSWLSLITSLNATQDASIQASEELGPERFSLAGADLQPEHLALAIGAHADRHYHRHAHDAPGLARLDVRGVDPQVRPVALDLAVEEGVRGTLLSPRSNPPSESPSFA
jgi:hypothetical protein